MPDAPTIFRDRFAAGEALVGTFLKIAHTMPAEVIATAGFDFVVVDEEHAPFNRESTDRIILACRAYGIGALVRVPSPSADAILGVLDSGADGVLVPHVDSAAKAAEIVAAARYRGGARGFSPTTRAGRFGKAKMAEHMDDQDARATVIAMIEDASALDHLDAIMAVDGLDGVFIGRGDLTVALGAPNNQAPDVRDAVARISAAARAAGKIVCVMVNGAPDTREMAALSATAFIVSSDQVMLRTAAEKTVADTRSALTN